MYNAVLLGLVAAWAIFFLGVHVRLFYASFGWELSRWWDTVVDFWDSGTPTGWATIFRLWLLLVIGHILALISIIVTVLGEHYV